MSLEDGLPKPEGSVTEKFESAPFVRKAATAVDSTRRLPTYQALVDFQQSHSLPESSALHILFTATELIIPCKSPVERKMKALGFSISLPSRKGVQRKIDEVELNAGNYENEDERFSAFIRALPDLRMLIAFGNQTLANRQMYERIRKDIELTGGIGLSAKDLAKYKSVDLSQWDLENMTFTPREIDFKLTWGRHGRLGGPKIDTRFVYLKQADGKLKRPKSADEWRTAFEDAYSTIT